MINSYTAQHLESKLFAECSKYIGFLGPSKSTYFPYLLKTEHDIHWTTTVSFSPPVTDKLSIWVPLMREIKN